MALKEKLFVVTVIFNPRGFKSRIKLYNEFAPYIEYCGAKLITVEIAFADRDFEVTDSNNPYHLQLRSADEMWHKERGLTLGIQHLLRLHPEANKLAWIDADVKFANPHWVDDTLKALDHYDFVQLFSQAVNLSPSYEVNGNIDGSVFYNFCHKIFTNNNIGTFKPYIAMGHPGLAWAATTKALDKVGGLIDFCIHGSGDSHMANALMGDVGSYYQTRRASKPFMEALQKWQDLADLHIKRNVGYVPGICYHYWHGKMHQRQYRERWEIICDHDFDPGRDIYETVNGLYRFTGNKREFQYDLRHAMIQRHEDSTDL